MVLGYIARNLKIFIPFAVLDVNPFVFLSSHFPLTSLSCAIFASVLPRRTNHPFYADTKTGRTTWNHPYDDPTYIASLPDTHPANPNSAEAREARERWEAEVNAREAAAAKAGKKSGGQSSDASWEARHSGKGTSSSAAAAAAASNGVESHDFTAGAGTGSNVRTNNKVFAKRSGIKGFKDKLMGGTKEEREEEKKQRRERERVRLLVRFLLFLCPGSRCERGTVGVG